MGSHNRGCWREKSHQWECWEEAMPCIDCYIVLIIKNRKVLLQQQLVSECIEQDRMEFKPETKAIK